ncbi:MAG TPA: alpha/beta fold hydrolase [Vicinamibacterales bacterium]|nr:alpha/beta fold hydrolase [Vicinamibacterales bacterium]
MSTRVLIRSLVLAAVATGGVWLTSGPALRGQQPQTPPPAAAAQGQTPPQGRGRGQGPAQNFEQQLQRQAQTDATWRAASAGMMTMEKTTYKSRKDGLEIPVFVFTPLKLGGDKAHPAIVWVHPDIRGHLYEYYIPYVREAIARGYVVVAPEYRGSVGYGQAFYDAIDYGGAEVDDVLTAVDYIKSTMPFVDPARIGIIGWSHGGMITLLSITREPATFKTAVAMVPVTNLFQRLSYKNPVRYHQQIDPANRIGGLPGDSAEVNAAYKERSAIYQIDKLQIPLLVHITRNDADVNFEEAQQLVDALRARKADLAETKIYDNPQGGHLFDRQCPALTDRSADPAKLESYTPTNTREQRDSWARVWAFLDYSLDPYRGADRK